MTILQKGITGFPKKLKGQTVFGSSLKRNHHMLMRLRSPSWRMQSRCSQTFDLVLVCAAIIHWSLQEKTPPSRHVIITLITDSTASIQEYLKRHSFKSAPLIGSNINIEVVEHAKNIVGYKEAYISAEALFPVAKQSIT